MSMMLIMLGMIMLMRLIMTEMMMPIMLMTMRLTFSPFVALSRFPQEWIFV